MNTEPEARAARRAAREARQSGNGDSRPEKKARPARRVYLTDADDQIPGRLYVTVSTPGDVNRLEEYVTASKASTASAPFVFRTFGKSRYDVRDLEKDLEPTGIKLKKSDGLGTTNQTDMIIVYRKVKRTATEGAPRAAPRSVLAVRVNDGTLFVEPSAAAAAPPF